MKAFEVQYETGGKSSKMTVLCENEEKIEQAVSDKDMKYIMGNRFCRINSKKEVRLSTVLLSQLSITEWLMIK